jgi:quinol monooxygenase YgiN
MITTVAMLTVKEGHQEQVLNILKAHVSRERKMKGCLQAYYKPALNNNDTYLVYAEYDSLESFQAAEKQDEKQDGGKVEAILRPHILKAFHGSFE